ncbi:MAG: type IV secretory system conjugative DNA transfer family protein [Micavibrio sp.]
MSQYKIALCVCGLLFGLFAASFMASALFYAWCGMDSGLVQPWSIWTHTSLLSDPLLKNRFLISLGIPHALIIGIIISFSIKHEPEYGDAHWASWQEINDAGLFSKDGLILGKYKGQYLVSDSPTHAMVIAPTRSGKGVGLVVPNLLNWSDSLICLDIKNENYKKTAGFRHKHGHDVFMWSPLDPKGHSHRYNPLDAVSADPFQRVSDIQIIANILIKDPPKGDPVWASEARALFVGLALYVLDNEDMPSTIGAINRLLGTEQDLGDIVRHIVKSHPELSGTIKKSLMTFANKAAKERSGVKTSINQSLNLWDNPVIDAATAQSDFNIADMRKKRMAIYVGVLTGQMTALSPLLRIFFEQVMTTLSMQEPQKDEPYKVLMMLDEFHMLGEMSAMTSAFTLLGGYNCRVMAIVQGLKWLDDVYGKDKRDGILSCCAHQVFFAANDLETASYVSNSCGEKTVKTTSTSRKSSMKYESPSKSTSFRAQPLISKDKVRRLPKNEEIIITEASVPVRARKIVYFRDRNFKDRIIAPPDIPKLRVISYGIPQFDIPSENANDRNTHDPNQMDIFKAKPNSLKADLSDWIDDAAALREENSKEKDLDNTQETSMILRFLEELSDCCDETGNALVKWRLAPIFMLNALKISGNFNAQKIKYIFK